MTHRAVSPTSGQRHRRVITEAIHKALEERWQQLRSKRRSKLNSQLEDLLRRVDALPTLDSRPEDEILGYDDAGYHADGD